MLDPAKSYCVCISGQMRLYEKVFAGIKTLFEGTDTTFIVSVWDLRGGKMFGALNPYQCQRMFPATVSLVIPPTFLYDNFYRKMPSIKAAISDRLEQRGTITAEMIKAYFPDAIVDIETDAAITDRLVKLSTSESANSYRMFYKLARANDIKRDLEIDRGMQFDIVIRTRPDRPLNTLEIQPDITPGSGVIYLDWFQDTGHSAGDQVAIGTSAALDRYSSLFRIFDERIDEEGRTAFWSGTHRELAGHLKAQGLTPRQITPHLRVPMEDYLDANEFVDILRVDEDAAEPSQKPSLTHFRASIEAGILLTFGDLDSALAKCAEGIAARADLPGAYYVRAQIHREQKQFAEALDAANNALRLTRHVRADYFFINDLVAALTHDVDIAQCLEVTETHSD